MEPCHVVRGELFLSITIITAATVVLFCLSFCVLIVIESWYLLVTLHCSPLDRSMEVKSYSQTILGQSARCGTKNPWTFQTGNWSWILRFCDCCLHRDMVMHLGSSMSETGKEVLCSGPRISLSAWASLSTRFATGRRPTLHRHGFKFT